ncbi:MAG: hypothetical protein D6731_09380 [Planctomycetota bacterium]|nr:MAG: hypothetical protein D6731_09380 [Planctomycetota bacterium]
MLKGLGGLLAAGSALGLGAATVAGEAAPSGLRLLGATEARILRAAAERLLAGTPLDEAALAEVLRWIDGYLRRQGEPLRTEVRGLLWGLELSAPLFGEGWARFSRRDADSRDAVLRAWSTSRFALFRQGYAGLKGLVLMAGYRQPAFLRSIGYDGPPHG